MSKQIGNSLTGLGVLFFQLAESVRWGESQETLCAYTGHGEMFIVQCLHSFLFL